MDRYSRCSRGRARTGDRRPISLEFILATTILAPRRKVDYYFLSGRRHLIRASNCPSPSRRRRFQRVIYATVAVQVRNYQRERERRLASLLPRRSKDPIERVGTCVRKSINGISGSSSRSESRESTEGIRLRCGRRRNPTTLISTTPGTQADRTTWSRGARHRYAVFLKSPAPFLFLPLLVRSLPIDDDRDAILRVRIDILHRDTPTRRPTNGFDSKD